MATKGKVTMGEESESEDESPETAAVAAAAPAVTMGEEDESEDEETGAANVEDDFAALEPATPRAGSEGSGAVGQESPTGSGPGRARPGFITWRHKTLRSKNRQLRRALLTRVCGQPKMVSAKLHDLDGMISRQQAAAQDASDLLQVLRVDTAMLHDKLALMLSNTDFVPALHVPCHAIKGLSLADAKERLSAISFPRVVTSWHKDTFRLHHTSVGATSALHYKLQVAGAGGAGGAEPSIEVIESHRDVTLVHGPFMTKLRADVLQHMEGLQHRAVGEAARKTALCIVDIQNDFVAGALRVGGAEDIIEPINAFRRAHRFDLIVLTQDSHPADHCSFSANQPGGSTFDTIDIPAPNGGSAKQMLWPTHCVAGTNGEAFHKDLILDGTEYVQRKGESKDVDSYSGIFNNVHQPTGLAEMMQARGVTDVFICGLAFDYCAGATACDASEVGFRAYLVDDLCRAVSRDSEADMRKALVDAGVEVITSADVGQVLERLGGSEVEAVTPDVPSRTVSPLSADLYAHLSEGYRGQK